MTFFCIGDGLMFPMTSSVLSMVARCDIDMPLWLEIVRRSWWEATSSRWMRPVAMATRRSEPVREIVRTAIRWLNRRRAEFAVKAYSTDISHFPLLPLSSSVIQMILLVPEPLTASIV